MDKKDKLALLIGIPVIIIELIFIVFIENWQNNFKTDRQICEENGGVYIEDLSAHNQHKCMYGLKNIQEQE